MNDSVTSWAQQQKLRVTQCSNKYVFKREQKTGSDAGKICCVLWTASRAAAQSTLIMRTSYQRVST